MPLLTTLLLAAPALAARWEPRDPALYNQGLVQLEAGSPASAEASFREALDTDPRCGMALHGLGVALLHQDRPAEALEVMDEALDRFPDHAELLVSMSEAAFASQSFQRAGLYGAQALELDPGSLEALVVTHRARLRLGEYDAAAADIAAHRSTHPRADLACLEAMLYVEIGDTGAASEADRACALSAHPALRANARAALASGDPSRSQVARDLGMAAAAAAAEAVELLRADAPADAIALLDEALLTSPDAADARLVRGHARYRVGDLDGAAEDLTVAFEDGTWVDVHEGGALSGVLTASQAAALDAQRMLGAALMVRIQAERGERDAAAATLSGARSRWGASAALSGAEARLLAASGGDPWPLLSDALARWPGDEELLACAGELALASTPPPEIQAMLRDSGAWQDRYNLAVARANGGDPAGCLAELGELAGSAEAPAPAQILAYTCAVRAGDLTRADALQTSSASASAARSHAWLRYESGDPEGALALIDGDGDASRLAIVCRADLEQWEAALEASADADAESLRYLGASLVNAGRYDEARGVLARACPGLSGEARVECEDVLRQLSP